MSLKPRRVDFNDIWTNLKETIEGIINCDQVSRQTWNDRFSDVYVLCVAHPDPLSDKLYSETKKFLEAHVRELYQKVSKSGEENVLSMYHHSWRDFSQGAEFLNRLYGYLNNQYVRKQKFTDADMMYGGIALDDNAQMLEIGELAFDTWKRRMIEPLKDQLVALLLEEIQKDRSSGTVNQSVVHGVVQSLVLVEEYKKTPLYLYETLFEQPFLQQTAIYYRNEALSLLDENSCSDYMEKVIQKLSEENFRSRKFLHASSYTKVTKQCQQCMVAAHLGFLHGECTDMVKNERRRDLANMYELLQPVAGGLGTLVHKVEEHIRSVGQAAIQGLKGEEIFTRYVESLLDVHTQYKDLILTVFHGDQQFIGALDKACTAVLNKTHNRSLPQSPELLARYCDSLLRKSAKGMSESEIDDKLANSITIFKYLDDKDVYQRYYSRMLARRLIHSLFMSMDLEEAMINRLKQACGYEFTNKLHRMFTDMSISKDLSSKFSDWLQERCEGDGDTTELGLNFSMLVLQAGAWPINQNNLPTFAMPQEVEKCVTLFERFYQKSFSGRKLTWMHNSCQAELNFNYLKRRYIVSMGSFQMGLLLPFNNATKISYQDLAVYTQLPEAMMTSQLQALVDSKILNVEGEIGLSSTFALNMAYNNKRTKFKIAGAQKEREREQIQETERTQAAIDEDRKLFLHAAIVRIMKSRKQIKHNGLIQQVIDQSKHKFSPSVSLIKKCIESLIDKQYLERAPNTTDEYLYVA